ncbi:MAG: NUDIX domain-containing protein [Parcubacteria group bacterium]
MVESKIVICRDIKGGKYEIPVRDLVFRPSVNGVIIEKEKVLLIKDKNGYDFPGGGIELGEIIPITLKREVKEETGYDIKIGEIITCQDSFFRLPFADNFVHSILIYYSCKVIGGKLTAEHIDEYEQKVGAEPKWVDTSDVAKIKFCNSVDSLAIIERAKKINPANSSKKS